MMPGISQCRLCRNLCRNPAIHVTTSGQDIFRESWIVNGTSQPQSPDQKTRGPDGDLTRVALTNTRDHKWRYSIRFSAALLLGEVFQRGYGNPANRLISRA